MKEKLTLVLVGNENTKEAQSALKKCGWCEFRVDEFLKRKEEKELAKWLSLKTTAKKIGTVRRQKEHQGTGLAVSEKKRAEIYKDILEYVNYVDVEIKSSIAEQVIKEARRKKRGVIASYHNFSKTPSFKTLKVIYREGRRLNPDIIKIAAKVNKTDELFSLLAFTHKYSQKFPLVIAPMGVSFAERIIPLYLGSAFTYIALTAKTASGQIIYNDLLKYCLI
ncbi:MAG: type I 3-dehydroquinate dehydratase [Elusimicrobia bacterium]|nr:type I 3-dehydroquinate dehydratase [Elusimicrobiota bacterium]